MDYLRSLFSRQNADLFSDGDTLFKRSHEEGVYYSQDNLKNFKIRVVLRKVTASAPQGGIIGETGRMSRASNTAGDQAADTEVWVFKWQEKVFSQHEDELYADANNCVSPLQLQYHRDIVRQRSEGCRPNGRLFSYVEKDHKQPKSRETTNYHTFASEHSSSVRRRHIKQGVPKSVIREPVLDRPSDEQRVSHRINTPSSQSMCLMVDLRKQDGVDHTDEHVLCQITVDSRGRVSVSPDFTREDPAIRIENRHKEVFEYRLEDISNQISPDEQLKEVKVQQELYTRHANYLKAMVGESFISPTEDNALRVWLRGEIVSAKGFECDDLYVKAQLSLPEGWLLDQDSPTDLSVLSQICKTKSKHLYNVAYFGCPFEYQLIQHPTQDLSSGVPRLLLEVGSLDYWERHRIEGYSYVDIPTAPGSHELTVHTWRPAGRGLVDELRRYFVGGVQQINDLSYITCPRDFRGDRLSRYGFRTESSGSVKLRLYSLHQCNLLVRRGEDAQNANKHPDLKSTQATLSAIVNAKRRAHQLTSAAARMKHQ